MSINPGVKVGVQTVEPESIIIERIKTIQAQSSTTPGLLQLAIVLVLLTSFIFWLMVSSTISYTNSIIKTIGKDSVPSIVAAQEIFASLADMNASATNEFLQSGDKAKAAHLQYEQNRQLVADRLVTAAQNITYGDAERIPIRTLVDKLQLYNGLVEVARSKGIVDGVAQMQVASNFMHKEILPAVEALNQANFNYLNKTYAQTRRDFNFMQIRLYLIGGFFLALLVAIQFFLVLRMKRLVNIPLAIASIVLVVFVGWMSSLLETEFQYIKLAKQDAFDSINALWKARATAYDANSDESLYLLVPTSRQEYEFAFKKKTSLLVDVPVTEQLISNASYNKVQFKGYLGNELRNITFAGEKEVALEALKYYGKYLDIDTKIREFELSGQHQEAINLCLGVAEGESNWAFDKFNAALGKTIDINKKAFDDAINNAFEALNMPTYLGVFIAIFMVVMAWLGLQPRIREYY